VLRASLLCPTSAAAARIGAATAVIDVDGRAGQLAACTWPPAGGALALRGGAGRQPAVPVRTGRRPTIVDGREAPVGAQRGTGRRARRDRQAGEATRIPGDRAALPLADALARGCEAAARWLHACVVDGRDDRGGDRVAGDRARVDGQADEVAGWISAATPPVALAPLTAAGAWTDAALLALVAAARAGRPPLALFHSHPDGRVALSAADVAAWAPTGAPRWPWPMLVIATRDRRATAAGLFAWPAGAPAPRSVARLRRDADDRWSAA
jgi:proteasome lid subunit RPN8/RPN11